MNEANPFIETAEKIHVVRLLEPDDCASLIARADEVPRWHDAPSHQEDAEAVFDASLRRNRTLQERDASKLFTPYRKTFERRFAKFLDTAQENFVIVSLLALHRYDRGDHFDQHVDALPTFHRERRYSVICYLNDDFVDGGTAFPTLGRTYRPAAGQAVLFPSHYLHVAQPVTSGHKYVIVFFLCEPPN